MALTDNTASRRSKAVEEINEALANIDALMAREAEARARHEKLVNNAKADVGTAQAEVRKAEAQYVKAREKLLALLPDTSPTEEADGRAERFHLLGRPGLR